MRTIKRALIIDDDEINNFICVKNMKDLQFAEQASYCLKGQEGLNQLKEMLDSTPEDMPEAIFLDINMPMMNGWEFLEEYKNLAPQFSKEIKLFILTSSVYRKDMERSDTYAEVADYIVKPLDKTKIRNIQEKHFQ
ncbi:MAG: response regulator [Bacteroidota bacterium]